MKKTVSAFTVACFLLSSSTAYCSQEESQKKTDPKPKLLVVAGAAIVAAIVYSNPLNIATQQLPSNPITQLNSARTVDRDCFAFSFPGNGFSSVSDVYGPAHTDTDHNEIYMQDALADIREKYPQATVNYFDCRYYNHKPYTKQ